MDARGQRWTTGLIEEKKKKLIFLIYQIFTLLAFTTISLCHNG